MDEKKKSSGWGGIFLIGLLAAVSILFIGIEVGKMYAIRNIVTEAVSSIDPFTYCSIHDSMVSEHNITEDSLSYDQLQNYAVELYIKMSMTEVNMADG